MTIRIPTTHTLCGGSGRGRFVHTLHTPKSAPGGVPPPGDGPGQHRGRSAQALCFPQPVVEEVCFGLLCSPSWLLGRLAILLVAGWYDCECGAWGGWLCETAGQLRMTHHTPLLFFFSFFFLQLARLLPTLPLPPSPLQPPPTPCCHCVPTLLLSACRNFWIPLDRSGT